MISEMESKNNTLYVSDMDGTLLGPDSRISAESARIISELSREGALITVATARTPATVVPLMRDTFIRPQAIVMTGAAGWDWAIAAFCDMRFITADHAAHILDRCAASGIFPFCYTLRPDARMLDVYHAGTNLSKAERSFYDQRCHLTLKKFHLGTPLPPDKYGRTLLFYAMGPRESIEPLAEGLRSDTDLSVSCYPDIFNSDLANLELLAPGVSKADAIRRVAADCGAERIVVFGDNLNDLPMFAIADEAVAVGNAMPQVKEAADIVIEPNYTDAVARFIEADYRRK